MSELFWAKVAKSEGCWLWTAATARGYGYFSHGGRVRPAHRVSFELASGESIPPGLFVCHRCDVPRCVRPDHLFLGTPKDNSADMVAKGRYGPSRARRGEANYRAKLDSEVVRQARLLASLGISHRWMASLFGVGRTTVTAAVNGANWKVVK